VARAADLRFVRIANSDDLFLNLWWASEANTSNEWDDRQSMLDPAEFFTFSTAFKTWAPMSLVTTDGWWHPVTAWKTTKLLREMERRLLPALLSMEREDEDLLMYESLPDGLKNSRAWGRLDVHGPQLPHAEWQDLFRIMPVGVPWTRRNRKLLILALSRRCHRGVRYRILDGLSSWGYHPREAYAPNSFRGNDS
jgi:hypothetical protein